MPRLLSASYVRRLTVFSAALAFLAGCVMPPPPPVANPEHVLDHYLCYFVVETQFEPPPGVTLKDQFDRKPTAATFVEREYVCNPVEKIVDSRQYPIKRPDAHLVCYRFDRRPTDGVVRVKNQFDRWFQFRGQKLNIEETWMLCLPSEKRETRSEEPKIPPDLDHFKCYRVKPTDETQENVILHDQFLDGPSDVTNSQFLCTPTEKWYKGKHTGIAHPEAHLVCYFVHAPVFKQRQRFVSNQFETNVLLTPRQNPPVLCLPSRKRVLTPPRIPQEEPREERMPRQ